MCARISLQHLPNTCLAAWLQLAAHPYCVLYSGTYTQPRNAVRRSLAGQARHDLGRRTIGIPLLNSAKDDLPFACFLELHSAPIGPPTASMGPITNLIKPRAPKVEVLEMIYVLEGSGQARTERPSALVD